MLSLLRQRSRIQRAPAVPVGGAAASLPRPAGAPRKVLLVNDTRMVGHHGSTAVVDIIVQQFAKRGIAILSHLQHGIDIENIGDHGCQAVVINGEGAMHGGGKHSHLFSRIAQQMRKRGIPVFLINTVFDEETPEIVARMRHFTVIYCRETQSVRRLAASGVPARVCPDLTFALDLPDGLVLRPGNRIVVLDTTIRSKNRRLSQFCLENDLHFQPIRTSPRLIRVSSCRNLLRIARFNATKCVGKLLPGVYAFSRYANALASSHAFLRRLADGTLVVVAARFHGVCFCLKIGVPFLAISSNTPKIEGMLADAGLDDRMLDIADLSVEVIRRRSFWSPEHEDSRLRYVRDAETRIADMFDDIARTIH
jgi:polysaccharide pyruvyl transferase WcaK-like protein